MTTLRSLALVFALFVVLAAPGQRVGAAEPFPTRPLKLVVPYAAGGPADSIARIVADGLQLELKQPVLVDNRAGASGTIGTALVAKAEPDGYTLLVGSGTTHAIAPAVMKSLPYDPVKDFVPISLTGNTTFVLLASPQVQAANLDELIKIAKARPGGLTFGTTGAGTVYDLAVATLESLTGAQFTRVPYKGFSAIATDMLGGRIDVSVNPPEPLGQSGKLRPLAVVGPSRLPQMPGVPTAAEAGLPGFEVPVWSAVFAPARTPASVVNELARAMRAAIARPEIRARLVQVGLEPVGSDPTTLQRRVQTDYERTTALVRSGRFKSAEQ